MRRRPALLAAALLGSSALGACAPSTDDVPACEAGHRLALVAQTVPDAAYVPCIDRLAEGWSTQRFEASAGRTRFVLVPDRAGSRSVRVTFQPACEAGAGVPTTPRADGVRTSIELRSISPRYAGTLSDAFPGGCVTYAFDFPRGPHIGLMADLDATVGLFSRRQLRLELRDQLGVELGP